MDCYQNEEVILSLAEIFKVLGDSTRTKILVSLHASDKIVNDIASELNMTVSAISHQLRILKNARLVKSKKLGKEVCYSLDDDHVMKLIELGLEHVLEKNE